MGTSGTRRPIRADPLRDLKISATRDLFKKWSSSLKCPDCGIFGRLGTNGLSNGSLRFKCNDRNCSKSFSVTTILSLIWTQIGHLCWVTDEDEILLVYNPAEAKEYTSSQRAELKDQVEEYLARHVPNARVVDDIPFEPIDPTSDEEEYLTSIAKNFENSIATISSRKAINSNKPIESNLALSSPAPSQYSFYSEPPKNITPNLQYSKSADPIRNYSGLPTIKRTPLSINQQEFVVTPAKSSSVKDSDEYKSLSKNFRDLEKNYLELKVSFKALQLSNEKLVNQISQLTDAVNRSTAASKHAPPQSTKVQVPVENAMDTNESFVPQSRLSRPPRQTKVPQVFKPDDRSYAAVTSRIVGIPANEQKKAIDALRSLRRTPRAALKANKLVMVYVSGIGKGPIRNIKKNLGTLHFRLSAIVNISFIGNNTAEFLITSDYAKGFHEHIANMNDSRIHVIDNFKASEASDPHASEVLKETITKHYVARLHGIIKNCKLKQVVEFYSKVLQSQGHPVPAPEPSPEDEFHDTNANVTEVPNPDEIPFSRFGIPQFISTAFSSMSNENPPQ